MGDNNNKNQALEPLEKNMTTLIKGEYEKSNRPTDNTGLILSVNAPFGAGKTFFLKHYKQALTNEKHVKTIYFNAWAVDNFDPLTGLIGKICTDNKIKCRKELKKIGKDLIGGKLLQIISGIALATISSKCGISGIDKNTIDEIKDACTSCFSDEVDRYQNKQSKIKEFKEKLSNIGQEKEGKSPLKIIMIDELDRCRPDYAISLLECCKHIFNTENCVFIIAIDRENLCAMIKKIYGNEFDANHYLSRFFDFEFDLPIDYAFFFKLLSSGKSLPDRFCKNVSLFFNTITIPGKKMAVREVLKITDQSSKLIKYFNDSNHITLYYFIPMLTLKNLNGSLNLDAYKDTSFIWSLIKLIKKFGVLNDVLNDKDKHNFNKMLIVMEYFYLPLSLLIYAYHDPNKKLIDWTANYFIKIRQFDKTPTQAQDNSITLQRVEINTIKNLLSRIKTNNNFATTAHPLYKDNLSCYTNSNAAAFKSMLSLVTSLTHIIMAK